MEKPVCNGSDLRLITCYEAKHFFYKWLQNVQTAAENTDILMLENVNKLTPLQYVVSSL